MMVKNGYSIMCADLFLLDSQRFASEVGISGFNDGRIEAIVILD